MSRVQGVSYPCDGGCVDGNNALPPEIPCVVKRVAPCFLNSSVILIAISRCSCSVPCRKAEKSITGRDILEEQSRVVGGLRDVLGDGISIVLKAGTKIFVLPDIKNVLWH